MCQQLGLQMKLLRDGLMSSHEALWEACSWKVWWGPLLIFSLFTGPVVGALLCHMLQQWHTGFLAQRAAPSPHPCQLFLSFVFLVIVIQTDFENLSAVFICIAHLHRYLLAVPISTFESGLFSSLAHFSIVRFRGLICGVLCTFSTVVLSDVQWARSSRDAALQSHGSC